MEFMNSTSTPCDIDSNINSTGEYDVKEEVREYLATFHLINDCCVAVVSSVAVVYYGSLCDQSGRRVLLLLTVAGVIFKLTVTSLVMTYQWPTYLLMVGTMVESLTGGVGAFTVAVFCYVADTSTLELRALRITQAEVIVGLATALSQTTLRQSIQNLGCLYTLLIMLCLGILNFLYVILIVFEPRPTTSKYHWSAIPKHMKSTLGVWRVDDGSGRQGSLCFIFPAFFIVTMVFFGTTSGKDLFLLDSPLCWTTRLMGIYSSVNTIANNVGQMLTLRIGFSRLGEVGLLILGSISCVVSLTVLTWATHTWMVFFGLYNPCNIIIT